MTFDGLDLFHLAGQDTVVIVMAFLPLLGVGTVSPERRWLLPLALGCTLAGWVAFVTFTVMTMSSAIHAWPNPPVPYQPLPMGRSALAIGENAAVLGVTLGLPGLTAYALLHYLPAYRGPRGLRRLPAVTLLLIYTLVATPWAWIYTYEDTFAAPGFTRSKWNRIETGMARTTVEEILGSPIRPSPPFAGHQGADCWVSNFSAGHFACVWFQPDRTNLAERKLIWYSD